MTWTDLAVAVAILIGIAGIIVPVLPGTLLILGAILVWTLESPSPAAWVVFAVAATFLVIGSIVKYTVPRTRMKDAGVPTSTMVLGAVAGLIGFFVIPYVGLFIGFVGGIYLAEYQRVGSREAWPSTKHALKAVGISILIELTAAVLATMTWTVGVIAT
ncbi:DUF456 domain-containing protein [Nocardioides sp.]|uniref:DUF456 domain-containing protein n=1 Tax=Nocardioides sp. TaxID=35761 RepID=UPI003D0C271F